MRIGSGRPKRRARIEIIPLIDIMFFLLATFIMLSLSMIKNLSVPVNLPSAASAQGDLAKGSVTVTVTKEGEVYWGKEKTGLEGLPARLKELTLAQADPKVFIHGDRKADFGAVVAVLDAVRKGGVHKTALRVSAHGN